MCSYILWVHISICSRNTLKRHSGVWLPIKVGYDVFFYRATNKLEKCTKRIGTLFGKLQREFFAGWESVLEDMSKYVLETVH